ncbi:MAG: hypothetical protein WAQ98_09855 [Blastocatellia bacterium]
MTQKNTLLTIEALVELESVDQPPYISLYQPTHRYYPENQQDPIRFRNLVKEIETSLRQKYSTVETRLLLEPFETLARDTAFWYHTLDGLAVLGGSNFFQVFQFQRTVAELTVVGNSFHTRPLRHFLQSVGRYQVLGLNLNKIQLFEGNRNVLDEIDLAIGVPQTITEALGNELTKSHMTIASYGGVGQASMPMHHSHGAKQEGVEIDTERFFRAVDRAVFEHHSKPSQLPLILAALPEHHHLFHQISHNPFLMAEGIHINSDALLIDELQKRSWEVVESHYQAGLAKLADEFTIAKSNGLGSDDLVQVAQAAIAGRVAMLLIEADRKIAGRLDSVTGRVEVDDIKQPQVDDLLDDMSKLVTKMGGKVMIIPAQQMPGNMGFAATYRY